ncbi:LADA_0B08482g1_1 [Lachancea dasiensis]|uniref:LADA_0B08482g1_1 n=1 Tax=Lachancea dasiensis TaxID=1072105 RepID=A0A1G4IUF8_9SACH|nr:LADA_0B08482g1_1 [Lachancea dasiensis]
MEDAITFIASPDRSKHKDAAAIEEPDDTAIDIQLPLLSRTFSAVLPPLCFSETIENASVRQNHNLAFLLWVLNSDPKNVDLSLRFCECSAPFQIFKTCFGSVNNTNYETFLQIRSLSEWSAAVPRYQVAIFPQILQTTKLDHFKTERLLVQYTQQFVKILESYQHGGPGECATFLSVNVSRLLQCYVNDTIYDIFYKWRQWNRIMGHLVKFSPFSQLVARFWDEYMVFQIDGSLLEFTTKLNRHPVDRIKPMKNLRSKNPALPQIRYGIWLDSIQGILLLSNTLTTELMDAVPSLGLTLRAGSTEAGVKKLLIFVNCCLMECITHELHYCA